MSERKKTNRLTYKELRSLERAIIAHIESGAPRFKSLVEAAESLGKAIEIPVTASNVKHVLEGADIDAAKISERAEKPASCNSDDSANRHAGEIAALKDRVSRLETMVLKLNDESKFQLSSEVV